MNHLRIEKSTDKNSLSEIREDWTNLFNQTNSAPFLAWEWIFNWYEKLGSTREIYLLKIYQNNELIGILPLCLQTKKNLGIKLNQLGFLGDEIGGADYLDLIAKDELKTEIWAEVFEFLNEQKDFDAINLENLAQTSASVSIIETLCKDDRNLTLTSTELTVCPQINLDKGWESVLQQSSRRSNFERRLKKLEKMDGFEFRSITGENEIFEAFERFAFLHEKRWENDGGSEATGLPQLMEFHRSTVKSLAGQKLVRFDEIWVEGECRASVYGLDNGETFYYYNAGYDLDWANKSVGLVLIGLSIKAATERGNKLYDFLRGEETYKFDWSNTQENLVTLKLNRAGFMPAINQSFENFFSFAKRSAKTYLPEETAAKIQNLKRNYERNKLAK